jgi:7,8-dihydropterin-6-yl-methyl-4-(beta-D-ribofuranosyl)aminobenzene 5'-phosphate synthase
MKLTLIADGSTKWQRFIRRWGVAFLIGEDVLFDTFGDPGVLLNNMRKFNIDAARIKHIVLSHDDWDHIAGLWYLIPNRQDTTVYVCPGFKQEIKDKIASFGVKIIEVDATTAIKDDIYSTGEICGESKGRSIYEQSVVIKTTDGLVVLCGCAHPGVVNIVQYVKENFHSNIYSLVGGFHLKDNADETNIGIIEGLHKFGVHRIAPIHCTGARAVNIIKRLFGSGCLLIREGQEITL